MENDSRLFMALTSAELPASRAEAETLFADRWPRYAANASRVIEAILRRDPSSEELESEGDALVQQLITLPPGPGTDHRFSIHAAARRHSLAIADIECEHYGKDPFAVAEKVDAMLRRLEGGERKEQNPRQFLIAKCRDEVVGVAKTVWIDEESQRQSGEPRNVADGYYLMGVTVAKTWRRLGLGSLLTTKRMEWVASQGATEVFCLMRIANAQSITFHERFGFVEESRDICYPGVIARGERALFRAPV